MTKDIFAIPAKTLEQLSEIFSLLVPHTEISISDSTASSIVGCDACSYTCQGSCAGSCAGSCSTSAY